MNRDFRSADGVQYTYQDADYGEYQRRELLVNWTQPKPRYPIRARVIALSLLVWILLGVVLWLLAGR